MPKRRRRRVRKPPKNPFSLTCAATAWSVVVSAILNRFSGHIGFWAMLGLTSLPLIFLAIALWRSERGYGQWLKKQFAAHRVPYVLMAFVFIPAIVYCGINLGRSFKAAWDSTQAASTAQSTAPISASSPKDTAPADPPPQARQPQQAYTKPIPKPPKKASPKKRAAPPHYVGFYIDDDGAPCTPENAMRIQGATASSNLPPGTADVTGFEFHGHPCVDAKDLKTEGNIQKGYVFEDDKQKPKSQEKPQQ